MSMYEEYESFLMVADYHAVTSLNNADKLRLNILNVVKDYIAIGVDPAKCVIFQQSQVQEHTELAWIFDCLVSVPFLMQGHAYKAIVEKEANDPRGVALRNKMGETRNNAGLFTYPMLMAADILLYDTDIVPVGEDQRQHLEYAREAAAKFNNAYGETFKQPKELISKDIPTIPGVDGKKMSKSYQNTIPLFGTDEEIRSAVMRIVTDSTPATEIKPISSVLVQNVISTASVLGVNKSTLFINEIRSKPYKEGKEMYADFLIDLITPMRKKRDAISDDDVKKILKEGSNKAREYASKKMADVRRKIGVTI